MKSAIKQIRNGRRLWSSHRRHIRKRVLAAHGLICWLCKKPIASAAEATMDHVKTVKEGGMFRFDNLRPAHFECNQKRADAPAPSQSGGDDA